MEGLKLLGGLGATKTIQFIEEAAGRTKKINHVIHIFLFLTAPAPASLGSPRFLPNLPISTLLFILQAPARMSLPSLTSPGDQFLPHCFPSIHSLKTRTLLPPLKPHRLYAHPAVNPWVSCLTSLFLSFLYLKNGNNRDTYSPGLAEDLKSEEDNKIFSTGLGAQRTQQWCLLCVMPSLGSKRIKVCL